MQAPPATDSQRPGLQRQSSSVVTRAAAAPGNGTSEEQRFLEHQHASGDALEKAAERLDPAGSASSGELVTEAAPLPDEFVAACSMNNDTDPKQVLTKLHGCTKALDIFAEEAKNAHGRSREANAQYVQKFKEVMEDLLALKDMKDFHKAFDKDDEAALQVLLGEATKSREEIETLAPSA